jgi:hypothetical protein
MSAVDPDFKEWEDGFNVENIPSTILDKSWHFVFNPSNYIGSAHTCLNFTAPVMLRVFLKGYRNPKEAIDTALLFADAIIKECTKPINRLNQPKIKNVLPGIVSVQELGSTNDNSVILELQFNCTIILES